MRVSATTGRFYLIRLTFKHVVQPYVQEIMAKGIKGSKFSILDDASHLSNWEQREEWMKQVGAFLHEQDQAAWNCTVS